MKKLYFGWNQFYRPLPAPLKSFLTSFKLIIGSVAVSSYVTQNEKLGFWLLVIGAFIDSVINFFGEAPEVTLDKTADRLQRDKPGLDVTVNIQSENEVNA